ncbi:MAG: hypothetical protein RIM23_10575 [Coleofasciculus sp. G3-WIS-01]|uniref:hypothetical protein n=1 Tax=Coleofasciculus sp. G3-WIS-01 TaxID=3069528 RepID=UPI0032F3CB98
MNIVLDHDFKENNSMESSDVATSKQTATVPSTASSTKARSHNGVFRWLTSFWNGLFGSKSPPHHQSLDDKSPVLLQAFILEPIYTPSGLVENFEEIWQQYDFVDSELLSMEWQFPYDYIFNLNYYWELNSTNYFPEVATTDQPLKLILKSCIRLDIQRYPTRDRLEPTPANFSTIIRWGKVTPSPWLEDLSFSPDDWLHLFFDIGGNKKIEALCRSLVIEQLAKQLATR